MLIVVYERRSKDNPRASRFIMHLCDVLRHEVYSPIIMAHICIYMEANNAMTGPRSMFSLR